MAFIDARHFLTDVASGSPGASPEASKPHRLSGPMALASRMADGVAIAGMQQKSGFRPLPTCAVPAAGIPNRVSVDLGCELRHRRGLNSERTNLDASRSRKRAS